MTWTERVDAKYIKKLIAQNDAAESLLAEAERVLMETRSVYRGLLVEYYRADHGDHAEECAASFYNYQSEIIAGDYILAKLRAHRETMGAGENDAAVGGVGRASSPSVSAEASPTTNEAPSAAPAATPALTVTREPGIPELLAVHGHISVTRDDLRALCVEVARGAQYGDAIADRVLFRWLAERGE